MADEATPLSLQNPRARMALVAFAVVALAAGFALSRRGRGGFGGPGERVAVRMDIPREPAGPAVRALFAPLTEGSEVEGWRIQTIEGVRDGNAHVVLTRGGDAIEVLVALRQGTAVTPPTAVGPYALFNMGLARLDRPAAQVIRALAERLRANASAPVPPGLGPFRPNGG